MSYIFKVYSKQYDSFMRFFKLDNNELIIKRLRNIKGAKVVDIGGGTGTLACKLIDLGAEVTIVDPEIKMTEIAKSKNEKIKIINGYSNNITLENESIDLIIIRDTLHHIREQDETIKECSRVLKKGGMVVIFEFDKKHIITKLISIFERCCFEKIKMLSQDDMIEITKEYFNTKDISKVSAHEYIYVGEKNKWRKRGQLWTVLEHYIKYPNCILIKSTLI